MKVKTLLASIALCFTSGAFCANGAIVEYHHAEFDHYFATGNPDELRQLDAGAFSGWKRTGHSFDAFELADAGTAPMCRFFSTAFGAKSSHFYTPIASECASVKANPNWQFEGEVFNVALPDARGVCPTWTVPLYRYYNNGQGGAPNHRYSTSRFMRRAMIDAGWIPEGSGDGVIACIPQSVSFGNGAFRVGIDIDPGTYRTRDGTSSCYYERLSGFGGTSGEVITNEYTNAPTIVTIAATDVGFYSSRCSTWTNDLSAITASQTLIPSGTFIVGTDVQPGTYRTRTASSGCYFERLRGFAGKSAEIITNEFTNFPSVVTISASDTGFATSGCATWTQDLSQVTENKTSFSDGVFIVGTDIEPGTYRTVDDATGCYYARLRGFSAASSDMISNFYGDTPAIVTIAPTDKGFESNKCGVWSKL